jgi:hypothetical protein
MNFTFWLYLGKPLQSVQNPNLNYISELPRIAPLRAKLARDKPR